MREWKGAVAFITGGGQGIGLGIARALAKRGVRLALADIDEAALSSSRRELAQVTDVEVFRLDVRDRQAFASVADEAESKLGPVSLLFNNAGIAPYSSLSKMRYEMWDLTLGVNLMGVVNGLQTFAPRMIERREGGYIVNTASGAGLVGGPNVLYTTSKYAVVGLSESLKRDAAKYGIEVSVLCPGPVATDILSNTERIGEGLSVVHREGANRDTEAFLRSGTSIDAVGEMVIAGMEAKAMWIHTDGSIKDYVRMRMEALLASMPDPVADEVS
ncbi:NAD(P)-dependent dehydrogenase (short-subunit alcohol dehydrogenase family) [Thermocatellispora tengchongensis]|uniref:NAD(P)-dependent dehydrogenase (Short-subunit alcohol dehydrogenase family) n=1 Tax=Thermocatellispora tengchongensis TaxID=1073253 RepID=A0A840P5W9_9ACTN|nr:SDR family NAD(P)-dependent oxidoreductase [Thermocatellispora tengchongensis]MBB5131405.1 NAD(P)-dependent dehydrogenase (short-subunit alcohol dehydrogenase family) [Thermocatellispora tengchongensis]